MYWVHIMRSSSPCLGKRHGFGMLVRYFLQYVEETSVGLTWKQIELFSYRGIGDLSDNIMVLKAGTSYV